MTDGQTDGPTEFSSLDRVCISCSAVKISLLMVFEGGGDHCLLRICRSELINRLLYVFFMNVNLVEY